VIEAIVRAALNQRIVVLVIALALIGFGVLQLQQLSVDAFPDVTNVQVQVAAEAPGRSPEEVERFVTVPLEIAMTGLPGLVEMRSVNRNSLSQIVLVFTEQTDIYFARQLVLERLIEVGARMPEGVTPVLGPVSSGLGEVYQYTLELPSDGERALSDAELTERRTIQDWVVRPMLRGVAGVAEINSIGGYERQYQVEPDPDRLRHYGLTLKDVYAALALNNANSGGGKLPHYDEQYLIRGVGLITGVEDIGDIVLKESGGIPIHVYDVAQVGIGNAVRSGAVIKNGVTESVGGIVLMFRGGNAKRIVSDIKARVQEINQQGMLPSDLQIVPFYDRSELVDAAIHTVSKVLMEGIGLVVIILFVFLGDIRSSLIVVATLIITPLCTFMVMNHYGISANLMSLGGLAIAIGMMVDGSVVVVENAFSHLGEHAANDATSKGRVLLRATREVGTPVVFGVGIICLVFVPLMTMEGIEGKLFGPLAYTIAIALFISLIVSLTLSPVLCSYLLKGGKEHDTWLIALMKKPYLGLLDFALGRPKTVVLISVGLLAASLSLLPLLGTSFIPEMMEGSIVTGVNRVPSMSLQESIKLESEAMRLVKEVPGIKMVVSQLGRSESPTDVQPENESTPIATMLPRDQLPDGWDQNTVMEKIREKLAVLPGVQVVMAQPISDRVDEMVTGVRSDIAIKVFGDELSELKRTADEIIKVLNTIQGASDVRVERLSGQQFLTIDIDRRAIARHGINVSDVNDIIETAIGGRVSTEVYEGERRFSAVVRFPESFRDSPEAIGQILLKSPNGALVRLEDLAQVRVIDGPAQISREMAKRRIVIGANVRDRDLGGFVAELQQAVADKVTLPDGYFLKWGGQFENLERASKRLAIIIPVTIVAIYFLLFMLFNSLRFAGLIILVLPFASMGGIISLFATGEYLSVPASVGFITLWGIAVLNGVVLVTYIRGLRQGGKEQFVAVREGCIQRFRPVMMTATVAMLGLVPFLFATGPGSEVQRPLAIVVIGGLITSTLLTLVVVPAMYHWFEDPHLKH
jgi:cobalt-zinc-cadmium resistance protein CzcA